MLVEKWLANWAASSPFPGWEGFPCLTSQSEVQRDHQGLTYRMNRRFKLKYAHFLAFHQWCFSRSNESPSMALAGGVLETVCSSTVHQPMLTCSSLRCGHNSNCATLAQLHHDFPA